MVPVPSQSVQDAPNDRAERWPAVAAAGGVVAVAGGGGCGGGPAGEGQHGGQQCGEKDGHAPAGPSSLHPH